MKTKNKDNIFLKYLYFGIDMFQFTLYNFPEDVFFYNELIWKLDDDNTPNGFIELFGLNFTYKKINILGYGDSLIFDAVIDGISLPIFSLLKGKKIKFGEKSGNSQDKVVLYPNIFILEYTNKIDFNAKEFVGLLFNYNRAKLYRMDVCLDIPGTIKDLEPYFLDMKKPSSAIGTDKKHPEFYQTYYLGKVKNSENRNYLIRIYDKVLDTFKKNKGFLYPHLQNNNDIRRIELEIRPEQAKKYHNFCILDLLDSDKSYFKNIFSHYINLKVPEEYHLDFSKLEVKKFGKRKFDLKKGFLDYGHIPANYITFAYGYIKNIVNNTGYNGLFQLLFNIKHKDIFLQKNIKSCINNILNNKPYNLVINKDTIINENSGINAGYDLLQELIIYLQKSPYISTKKINNILKENIKPIKLKLKK